MLGVQRGISGALLPVMPLPDISATPNSNSCHRDSTAQSRLGWELGGRVGGKDMELWAQC